MREIKGTIEDIIFMNPDNGYSVILIDYEGDPLTVVGNFPALILPIAFGFCSSTFLSRTQSLIELNI